MTGGRLGPRALYDSKGVWSLAEARERRRLGIWEPDPYWSNVVALLNMGWRNNNTTFIDERGHGFTATGNAKIDTTDSAFPNGDLLLDGTGDWISSPASTDWDISTGDWTIELFPKLAAVGSADGLVCRRSGGTNGWAIDVDTNGAVRFRGNVGGSWSDSWMNTANSTIISGTRYYVGIKRAGNVFSIWVDGTQKSTFTNSGSIQNESGVSLFLGTSNQSGEGDANGRIGAFRLTKGVARDLSVIPTLPFPIF